MATGLLHLVQAHLWLCASESWLPLPESCDDGALVALQTAARKTQDVIPKLHLKKLRRLQSHREPHHETSHGSVLTGAAWSDYAVEVFVGSESFPVIVDTGSSTFAIPTRPVADCQSFYTGACEGRWIEARYGSANWTGRICHGPEVKVAGLSAGRIDFAGIFEQNNFLTECSSIPGGFVSRGIIGMAYPQLLPPGFSVSLWDAVVARNGVPDMFAMQCCPWTGENRGSGSLTLGGFDSDLYKEDDFRYTPITMEKWFCTDVQKVFLEGFEDEDELGASAGMTQACSHEAVGSCILSDCQDPSSRCDPDSLTCRCEAGTCNILGRCMQPEPAALAGAQVGNQTNATFTATSGAARKAAWSLSDVWDWFLGLFHKRPNRCKGIIDTGTSSLILPKDVFTRLLANLNEVASSWQIRSSCLSESEVLLFPNLVIRLDQVELRVPPSTYFQLDPGSTCRSLYIRSSGALNEGLGDVPDYILGQPLLEAYYTLFDKEKKRIGFAPIKGCS